MAMRRTTRRPYARRRTATSVRRSIARYEDRAQKRTSGRWNYFAFETNLAGNTGVAQMKLPRPPSEWLAAAPITIYLLESFAVITPNSTNTNPGCRRGAMAGYKTRANESPTAIDPYDPSEEEANETRFRWWMPWAVATGADQGQRLMLSVPIRFRSRKNQIRLAGNENFYVLLGAEKASSGMPRLDIHWHGRYRFMADRVS